MKAFYVNDDINKGNYKVSIDMEAYAEMSETGPITSSFTTLGSRLFGMPHHMYLKMLRQDYAATLRGKSGYVIYSFKVKSDAERLSTELNRRWNALMFIKDGKPEIV